MRETYPVTAALTFVGSIMADSVGSVMADSVAAGSILADSKRALAADPVVAGLAFAEADDSAMELDGLKLEACTLHQCSTEEQLIHSC